MKHTAYRSAALFAFVAAALFIFSSPAYAARNPQSITINTALPTWGGVNVTVAVNTSGSDDNWESTSYSFNGGSTWACMDHGDHTTDGSYQETFTIPVPSGASPGALTLSMRAHSDDDCSAGTTAFPATVPVSTLANNPAFPASCGIDVLLILDESGSIVGIGGGGATDIVANVRGGAQNLWDSLLGTGSTMSVVEFNTNGRVVSTVQNLDVIAANTAAFTTYINGGGGTSSTRYNPGDYTSGDGCLSDGCYTNWQDAFLKGVTANSPPKHVAFFFTDGVPTTNNEFTSNTPENNYDTATHRHVGYAALAANALKAQGTRVVAVGVANGSDPTIWLPNVSGPTAFSAGNVATADYTTTTAAEFGNALRAAVLEACQASVTVNKTVLGENDEYLLADGWEFTATASPTGAPFTWTAPAVSASATISGTTGMSPNSTGSLLLQWEPQDAVTPTTITIDETVLAGATFVDATCRDNSTQPPTLLIDAQTTLPVVLSVAAEAFVVCEFRNDPGQTAITLGGMGAQGPAPAAPVAGLVLLLGLGTAVVLLWLRRRPA
jgi:hypothetical protein